MRFQEVILDATCGKISWWQAAEVLGISPRTLRRWRKGYRKYGLKGAAIGGSVGGVDFSDFFINLSGQHFDTLADAKKAGAATINYGVFFNQVIKFVIIAFALFLLIKQINILTRKSKAAEKPAPPAEPPAEVKLLSEIRDLLKQRGA